MKFIDASRIPSQPYPELREVLDLFAGEVAAELKENLVGIYLVGSIATGDFDLDSDVDFLVVTGTELTEADIDRLQEIQVRVHRIGCYPAQHLEGSYISLRDLNDPGTVGQKELYYFDNGSTTWERATHDNQWHVRWILRERGIPLVGPRPETILQAVPLDKLIDEVKTRLIESRDIFQAGIDRPLNFCNSRFGQSFFVLTTCRMLHTIATGTVQSKKAGAAWAQQFVDPAWKGLIEAAWKEREGVRFMEKIRQRAEQALLDRTLEFMQVAAAQMEHIQVQEKTC
jgi:predicted nucleotidyltransferase